MIEVRENVSLAPYTYIKVGGPARFFVEVKTEKELREAIVWTDKKNTPMVVLGAGSNVLVADAGFDGLVIRMGINTISIEENVMCVGAGVSMAQAATEALKQNLSGFEWAAGIPGTIGGSVYGNAGCFGGEMQQVLERVRVLECKVQSAKCKIVEFQNTDCKFWYRESVFKKHKDWIILGATLKLKKISDEEKKEKQAWIKTMMQERVAEQAIGERTMGSTFKSISITDKTLQKITQYDKRFRKPTNTCWVFENRAGMMSAGFLIEQAGLKEKKIGGVTVSTKHANFLVTDASATAEHVIMLIALIKERVHRMFGVMLEEEIQYIGFD
ncbi:MAG: UDP-N-acetylmuramate dehydrogenase [Parcubacteria group bacterium Gr01-1014_29]|nr:MAG: UDP-N-acetylmuramate dehydrogenase [Parcubacteria group bacterium Gr01-1014_29]